MVCPWYITPSKLFLSFSFAGSAPAMVRIMISVSHTHSVVNFGSGALMFSLAGRARKGPAPVSIIVIIS